MFAAGAASSSQPSRVAQHPTTDFAMINCWGYASKVSSPCSLSLNATSAIDGSFLQAQRPPERTKPGTDRATLQWTSGHYAHRPWRPSRCPSPILPALTVALQPDDLAPDIKLHLLPGKCYAIEGQDASPVFMQKNDSPSGNVLLFVQPEILQHQRHSASSRMQVAIESTKTSSRLEQGNGQ